MVDPVAADSAFQYNQGLELFGKAIVVEKDGQRSSSGKRPNSREKSEKVIGKPQKRIISSNHAPVQPQSSKTGHSPNNPFELLKEVME